MVIRGGSSATAPQQVAALPPAADAMAQPSDHVFGGATPGKVVVTATADAWVEVLDNDHPIWSRLLKPGDVYYPPKDGLTMLVGNAAGVAVSVNGKALPPMGGAGEVRRFALDAAKLTGG
jgi:cytoskeleton protein RodZ